MHTIICILCISAYYNYAYVTSIKTKQNTAFLGCLCLDALFRPATRTQIFLKTKIFPRFALASTRKQRFQPKTQVFEDALQSEGFRKRHFHVYVWTGENEGFRKRRQDNCVKYIAGSGLYSDAGFICVFKILYQKCVAILVRLISSRIPCIQLHVAIC